MSARFVIVSKEFKRVNIQLIQKNRQSHMLLGYCTIYVIFAVSKDITKMKLKNKLHLLLKDIELF